MNTTDQLYIGGDWSPPGRPSTVDVVSPHTGEVIGSVPEALEADVDAAVAAARAAFDDPAGWPRHAPAERAACSAGSPTRWRPAGRRGGGGDPARMGCRSRVSQLARRPIRCCCCSTTPTLPTATTFEDRGQGMFGGPVRVRREPVGVAARDRALELPAVRRVLRRSRRHWPPGARSCSKPSAGDAARQRSCSPRRPSRPGLPAGVLNIVPGRPARSARTSSRTPASTRSPSPARPPWAADRRDLRRASAPGHPRAGRQVGRHRARRRRPRRLAGGLDLASLPATTARPASPRPASWPPRAATTRSSTSSLRGRAALKVGDPLRPGHQDRPDGQRAPARPRRGLHRDRPATRAPRSSPAAAARRAATRGWYVEPTVFADVDNDMRIAQRGDLRPGVCR